jgi:teichuronic acid biosynthesis glycosyltransferase TuaC
MTGLRIAVVSTFFPNSSTPFRTLFVRHLVTAMAAKANVNVVAPLPYAPPWPKHPRWQALRRVAETEQQGGLQVRHPRYWVIPKLWSFSGFSYARAVAPELEKLVREVGVDVIHVHCAYPDAVGVASVARRLGVPFVVTAHGSDINVYSQSPRLRVRIQRALEQAAAVVAVSEALRSKIETLAPAAVGRLSCIPCCGVDPAVFHRGDREAARLRHGIAPGARLALFVGNMVAIKGVDTLLAAWQELLSRGAVSETDQLVLVGDGTLRPRFETLAATAPFRGTVRFLGAIPQVQIASWMQAADTLCLSSRNEGMPNVVVEALASGLPVVATPVGGVPELVKPRVNGELAASGDPAAFADALARGFARKWDADQIAASVSGYNWESLAASNLDLLSRAVQLATTR